MTHYKLNTFRTEFPLREGENIIGSHRYCQVHLVATGVAGEHARIDVSGDNLTLTPLVEAIGTYVGDERLDRPKALAVGDRILIAGVEMYLTAAEEQRTGSLSVPRRELGRRRVVRWLRNATLLVMALALIPFFLFRAFINGAWIKDHLERTLQARLRRVVSIEECRVGYLGGEVVIKGLTIENKAGFRKIPFVRIKEIRARLPLLRTFLYALDGEYDLRLRVKVFGTTVYVQRNDLGVFSYEDLLSGPRAIPAKDASLAARFPGTPIDIGLESIDVEVTCEDLTVLLRDDVNGANFMARGTFSATLPALAAPLEYRLHLAPATSKRSDQLVLTGHVTLFTANGQITAESIRGNLLTARIHDLDLGRLGRRFRELALCERLNLELEIAAQGLHEVNVHLRVDATNLGGSGLRLIERPVPGLDLTASIDVGFDLVERNVWSLSFPSATPLVRVTYRESPQARPVDLLWAETALRVERDGRSALDGKLTVGADLTQLTRKVLREAMGIETPVNGNLSLTLQTQGNLSQAMTIELTAKADGTIPQLQQQAGWFSSQTHFTSRLSFNESGRLKTLEITTAEGRTTVRDADGEHDVLQLALQDGRPLVLDGLDQPDRPIKAEGTLSLLFFGDPIAQWMEKVLDTTGLPRDDIRFDLTAVSSRRPGQFSLKPRLRILPRGQDGDAQALVAEGRADFDLREKALHGELNLYDRSRQAIDQLITVQLRGWDQPRPTWRVSTRGVVPIRLAPLLAVFERYGVKIRERLPLDGELRWEASVAQARSGTITGDMSLRAPSIRIVRTRTEREQNGQLPAVHFDISSLQARAEFEPTSGVLKLRPLTLTSSFLDADIAVEVRDPSAYVADAAVTLQIKDLQRAAAVWQILGSGPRHYRPGPGQATLDFEVKSSARELTIDLKTFDLSAEFAEVILDPDERQPVRLRFPALADILHPVYPVPVHVQGTVQLAGRSRNLAALSDLLSACGLPGLRMNGATEADGLRVRLDLDGSRIEVDATIKLTENSRIFAAQGDTRFQARFELVRRTAEISQVRTTVHGGSFSCSRAVLDYSGERLRIQATSDQQAPLKLTGLDINRYLTSAWGLADCAYGRLDVTAHAEGAGTTSADIAAHWNIRARIAAADLVVTRDGMKRLPLLDIVWVINENLLRETRIRETIRADLDLCSSGGRLRFEPNWSARFELRQGRVHVTDLAVAGASGIGVRLSGWIDLNGELDIEVKLTDADVLPRSPATARRDAFRDLLKGKTFHWRGRAAAVQKLMKPALDAFIEECLPALGVTNPNTP